MVGLFAFMTVGTAVVIDLWSLLDIRRGYTLVRRFAHYFHDSATDARRIGTRRQAFRRQIPRSHRRSRHRLSILVLGSFRRSHENWYRRRVYVARFPADAHRFSHDNELGGSVRCPVVPNRVAHFSTIEIRYFDTIVLQHKQTKTFLHSHVDRYPLKYPDGRVSSAGTSFRPSFAYSF